MSEIRQLRKESNLSQAKFAEKYSIPLRTLQEWEQGRSDPPVWAAGLIRQSSFHVRKNYPIPERKAWRICIDRPFRNCEKIYPIQQRKVRALIDSCSRYPDVLRILIFGSSVTDACHIGSDVDIYVEAPGKEFRLSDRFDFAIDLWTDRTADKRLKNEILKKGVCVYERPDPVR